MPAQERSIDRRRRFFQTVSVTGKIGPGEVDPVTFPCVGKFLPVPVCDGERGKSAVAADLRGHALGDLAEGIGRGEERKIRMCVDIHKTGTDKEAFRVDLIKTRAAAGADLHDPVVRQKKIG